MLGSLSVGDRDGRTGSVPHADKGEAAMFLPLRREMHTQAPTTFTSDIGDRVGRDNLVYGSLKLGQEDGRAVKKNASSNLFCDKFNEAKYIFLVLKFISALCTLNNHTDISTF